MKFSFLTKSIFTFLYLIIHAPNLVSQDDQRVFEEVIVTAEKRSESLQSVSQAVTAISDSELENKNINSFVDLTSIVPGVTVAKNEGYKTVISIRGVGNETNQNAIAAPSVAYHMDGIFIASPFSLQTDFIDVQRIEILRGPQGTLFGQNSTGGAINVISNKPTSLDAFSMLDVTLGDYGLTKLRATSNLPISNSVSTKFSFTSTEWEQLQKIRKVFHINPKIIQFWKHGKTEVSMFWDDVELGLDCKARMDWYDADSMKIVDLKFTNNIGKFSNQKLMDQHFSIQAAWYRQGVYQLTGNKCEFLFVFVEKYSPHKISVIEASEEIILHGEQAILNLIKRSIKKK